MRGHSFGADSPLRRPSLARAQAMPRVQLGVLVLALRAHCDSVIDCGAFDSGKHCPTYLPVQSLGMLAQAADCLAACATLHTVGCCFHNTSSELCEFRTSGSNSILLDQGSSDLRATHCYVQHPSQPPWPPLPPYPPDLAPIPPPSPPLPSHSLPPSRRRTAAAAAGGSSLSPRFPVKNFVEV